MREIQANSTFQAYAKNDTKSLFLGEAIVTNILQSIRNQKFKGRLDGEINRYIQGWEFYPNSNAVYFLCRNIPNGNISYFTNKIQLLVERYNIQLGKSVRDQNFFLIGRGNNEIRFMQNENSID